MEKVRYMRLLRLEYNISLKELAIAAGVSSQYISDIELGKYHPTASVNRLIDKAFENVIHQRIEQLVRLSDVYYRNRLHLLESSMEGFYEL